MGIFDKIKKAFSNETDENPHSYVIDVDDPNAHWRRYGKNTTWQIYYAFVVVQKLMAMVLSNVNWDTFRSGEKIKGEEWFRFNVAPNRRQTSVEFFSKLAEQLTYNGEALIIETAQRELFVADSYSFKDEEKIMKDNTFVNVVLGTTTLNRTFKENDSCMYIKFPNYQNVEATIIEMGGDYNELKQMIYEGAQKALGMKLALNLGAQAKNKYDEKYLEAMQNAYRPLMQARDAVFITYKGETLADLTEKQRGSEVQQVLSAVDNNIKMNDEVVRAIGMAFGIPEKFMKGDLTADNDSIYEMFITMFAKPILRCLSQKFTFFALTREDIIEGGKIEADLNSIKFVNKLSMATAVDKLIGSGAYNPNEVREMLDDDPYDGGDVRFITKNYAVLSEYTRGGDNST